MELNPHLNFNRECAEAFRFYEKTPGGTIVMMRTRGETPMKDQVPATSPADSECIFDALAEGGQATSLALAR
jgi:uncharacterized glyoxalase superfamily protein PhnB